MPAKFPRLLPPQSVDEEVFVVRARSARVERDWASLAARVAPDAQRCYVHLATDPYRRVPGRVFPLRGKVFAGLWEFEVNRSDRLYYLPDAQRQPEMSDWAKEDDDERVCLVFACGGHVAPPQR